MALSQVVDRWVRDLREALLEVGVQGPRPAGERRQRRVVAHRRGRLVGVRRDRPQDLHELLARVPEGHLAGRKVALLRFDGRPGGARDQALLEPAAVGAPCGETAFDRVVALKASFGIHGQDLARTELAASNLPVAVERDGTDLGHAGDETVRGDRVPERPEPVAIERGADDPAVGEDDPGGAVPGLDQA